jgi:hypothetical protein
MMGEPLVLRQEAAQRVEKRMLDALLDYIPCAVLAVNDVKFIAAWSRTLAFDAMSEVDKAENRT